MRDHSNIFRFVAASTGLREATGEKWVYSGCAETTGVLPAMWSQSLLCGCCCCGVRFSPKHCTSTAIVAPVRIAISHTHATGIWRCWAKLSVGSFIFCQLNCKRDCFFMVTMGYYSQLNLTLFHLYNWAVFLLWIGLSSMISSMTVGSLNSGPIAATIQWDSRPPELVCMISSLRYLALTLIWLQAVMASTLRSVSPS